MKTYFVVDWGDLIKNIYGRDKRIDFATVSVSGGSKILDKYLIEGLLDSLYSVIEENNKVFLKT